MFLRVTSELGPWRGYDFRVKPMRVQRRPRDVLLQGTKSLFRARNKGSFKPRFGP